ncbi:CHAP domain-containing protein [Candidatus Saccharibacteria bacterium]|jgi:surface antigen/peptidoglycan hydrolase CwlO-like protein|nr:CHAP domain-containing protein [Candidatus Saccharibacteria bacterium]
MQHKINIKNADYFDYRSSLMRFMLLAIAIIVFVGIVTSTGRFVFADERYDDQIHAAKEDADMQARQADELSRMADNYQAELVQLQNQSRQIQESLEKSQRQHASLSEEVRLIEKKLSKSQNLLSDIIVDIQIESEITPLEMIASSKTMSEYIDRQAHQTAMLHSLDKEVVKIIKVKRQLKERQAEVAREVALQKNQREQLEIKQKKQQKLINETRGEENRYRELASSNNRRVEQLRFDQAEQNRKATEEAMSSLGGRNVKIPPGILGGDYPFIHGPLDYGVDPWGLYYRECVSYAAWKVASTGRFVPHFGGRGNANEWPTTVAKFGIKNGKEPRKGSVAMQDIGIYGHVMYVEKVHDDNSITVSDYNLAWDGLYRKYQRSSGGLTYIYF